MMDHFVVRDVQKVKLSFWNSFAMACGGTPPTIDYTVPEFLTPERVLQVRVKLLKQEAELIAKLLEPLNQEGISFWEDEIKVLDFMTSAGFVLETNDER